ncbi:MAG: O-acetyl-ADP-ribose deacetylase [Peptococcia bacterium]|jgi:O-acetyl-ADP-ribose deacetylase (regulator of RNase III)
MIYNYRGTTIKVIKEDITKVETEAIVNAANNSLLGGGGVDGAIHRAGGPAILEECKKLGGCPTGEAKITTGGNLPCQYVIHTVGPRYRGDNHQESKLLYNAYYNSLKVAVENNVQTIAFPSISTGVYKYPLEKASEVAIKAVKDFLDTHQDKIKEILFVLFSNQNYQLYLKKLSEMIK